MPAPLGVAGKAEREGTPRTRPDPPALRFFRAGRAERAMEALREALARHIPRTSRRASLRPGSRFKTDAGTRTQHLLEKGLEQVPKQHRFARMLARVYVDQGAEAKALAAMESASPDASDDADFSALLGLLYQRAGRHADAVQAYEQALQLRPGDGRAWLGFAISLEATEQPDVAKEAYQRAYDRGLQPLLARYAEQRLAALGDR